MNGLPYYKAYPRDFLEGTIGMSFEVKGAYRLILDLIYMQGGKLPDNARYISGNLGCSVRKWNAIRAELIERRKIHPIGEFLVNYRADKELESLRKFQEKQSENARGCNKNKDIAKPRQIHTEPEPEPEKNITSSRRVSEHRFDEFWSCYPHRPTGREAKSKVREKYLRAVKSGVTEADLIDAAKRYSTLKQVKDGYGRGPLRWFNEKGWEDEIAAPSGMTNSRGQRAVQAGAFGLIPERC